MRVMQQAAVKTRCGRRRRRRRSRSRNNTPPAFFHASTYSPAPRVIPRTRVFARISRGKARDGRGGLLSSSFFSREPRAAGESVGDRARWKGGKVRGGRARVHGELAGCPHGDSARLRARGEEPVVLPPVCSSRSICVRVCVERESCKAS